VYSRTACDFYRAHVADIVPPEGTEDDVVNLFPGSSWSPNKKVFDPRVVGKVVQDGIRGIALALLEQAGSGGHTLGGEEDSR